MNYNLLLDVVTELGYCLAISGAETFRIEESVNRIMDAYNLEAEVFAIPNCLHISIKTQDGPPITRMRRVGYHGNDLDVVEKFSNLSRKICRETPDAEIAMQWLNETKKKRERYSLWIYLLGNFSLAFGFSMLFGGSLFDGLCSGLCGLLIGMISRFMEKYKVNQFFKVTTVAFFMALLAYLTGFLGLAQNTDAVIIGALMILVPGLMFTNAMRDIIYGDTNSGIYRIAQVFLIAVAIALGTGAAWSASCSMWVNPTANSVLIHPLLVEIIACFLGCFGFVIIFNIHGNGSILCAAGGVLTWITFRLISNNTGNDITAYFWATIMAALYAEIMARIRKYPAISYLVISAIPLIPGSGIYYTMRHAAKGDMDAFASQGMHTIAIAGVMAVGILLISTIARIAGIWLHSKRKDA